jgi:hypothetical protein
VCATIQCSGVGTTARRWQPCRPLATGGHSRCIQPPVILVSRAPPPGCSLADPCWPPPRRTAISQSFHTVNHLLNPTNQTGCLFRENLKTFRFDALIDK